MSAPNPLSFEQQVKAAQAVLAERRLQRVIWNLRVRTHHNVIDMAAYRKRNPLLQSSAS